MTDPENMRTISGHEEYYNVQLISGCRNVRGKDQVCFLANLDKCNSLEDKILLILHASSIGIGGGMALIPGILL